MQRHQPEQKTVKKTTKPRFKNIQDIPKGVWERLKQKYGDPRQPGNLFRVQSTPRITGEPNHGRTIQHIADQQELEDGNLNL